MRKFKVGDQIEGKTQGGNIVIGTVVKINKTTYKLDNGALIKFDCASEVNMDHWDIIIENRAKTALSAALRSMDYTKVPYTKIKNAFIDIFGKSHYELVLNSIKKDLGL